MYIHLDAGGIAALCYIVLMLVLDMLNRVASK